MPILTKSERWGQLELAFTPTGVPHLFGMEMPWLYLVLFMFGSCLGAFYIYLGRMLRHLDVSHAVPARVRSALDTLAEGLLVIDKKQNIVLANQAFATLTGATPETLAARQVSELGWLGPDGTPLPKEKSPWAAALREGAVQRNSMLHFTDHAGKLRTFSANCSPVMGPDGKAGGVLISLDDITELESNKAELAKARDEAEAANRAKSDFLANMSHEIRTPMNAILGFTEVLKRGWGKNEREARKHLDTIHSSGKHLIELINDILDLSKVEAGRMEVERIDCEPHKVIREVVKVFNARAREKGVTLAFEVPAPIPERIQSDPGRLRQIVTNLVGNALKFTERGGVRVVARMAGTRSAPQLAIDVVDTGVGIPEDKIGKLFQAFVQADTSVTRKFGGTGLGLVLSRNFARALGGDITVDERRRPGQHVHRHARHRRARSACACSIRPRRRGWTRTSRPTRASAGSSRRAGSWSSTTARRTASSCRSCSPRRGSPSRRRRTARSPSTWSHARSTTRSSWTCRCR